MLKRSVRETIGRNHWLGPCKAGSSRPGRETCLCGYVRLIWEVSDDFSKLVGLNHHNVDLGSRGQSQTGLYYVCGVSGSDEEDRTR